MTAPPPNYVPALFSTSLNSSHLSYTLHVCSVKPSFNYLQSAVITSNALCCIVFKFLIKPLSHPTTCAGSNVHDSLDSWNLAVAG